MQVGDQISQGIHWLYFQAIADIHYFDISIANITGFEKFYYYFGICKWWLQCRNFSVNIS